jgi:hypothetical protein
VAGVISFAAANAAATSGMCSSTAHIAETGQQIVFANREPEFQACIALHHGLLGERYDGPVKFYRPGETAPYFLVASAAAIAHPRVAEQAARRGMRNG